MRNGHRVGKIAFAIGVIAVCLAFAAHHASSVYGYGSTVMLDWADRWGLIKPPVSSTMEFKPDSVAVVTDRAAISIVKITITVMSVSSTALALFAEYRKEETLYLSGAFILGPLALTLIAPMAGLILFGFGIASYLMVK